MVDRVVSETTPVEGNQPTHVSQEDFVPYSIYRDSGVEWLGEIPAHWETRQLKRLCTFEYGDSLSGDSRMDGHVDVYGSNGPIGSHNDTNTLGPCLVIGRKGSFGKVNYSCSAVFAIDTTFFVDCRHTDAQLRWLYYLLTVLRLDTATKDSAIPGLDREDAYAHIIPVCGLPEQRAVAAFLDRETAKIDALVAKKERLIELLQEKRTALISRAVTKGLDPNVPMKDSSIEWLGEIPAHWSVTKLRRLITQVTDPLKVQQDQVYREIGIRSWGRGIFHKDPVMGAHLGDKKVFNIRPGELVLNIVFAWEGAVAMVSEDDKGMIASHRFPTFQHMDALVHLDYLLMLLQSEHGRALMGLNSPGAAGRNRTIRIDSFLDEEIPLPPPEEQKKIVTAFRSNEQRLQFLSTKVRVAVELLKEFRTSLISAAVIGRIDVREDAA